MGIGAKIKAVRELRNISAEEMAERLNMSVTAYRRWERDESATKTDRLQAASVILETPIEEFLNHDHLTITMKNKSGANGYHVVQHQASIPSEALDKLVTDLTDMVKEQHHQINRLVDVVERLSQGIAGAKV